MVATRACSLCALPRPAAIACQSQCLFSIFTLRGKSADDKPFFTLTPPLSSDYVRLPVCRFHQVCRGNFTVKLFNHSPAWCPDEHGTILITHYKFRARYVIRQRIITGQQRQQRRGVGSARQTIGFIVQQQVAEAF